MVPCQDGLMETEYLMCLYIEKQIKSDEKKVWIERTHMSQGGMGNMFYITRLVTYLLSDTTEQINNIN